MRQVQRPRRVLLHAEVQRLYTSLSRPICSILQELQTRTSEALLLLENALVANRHFEGSVIRGVKARLRDVGELEDLTPLEVIALDVVGVKDGVGCIRVELRGVRCPGGRHTSIEDDGAFDVCAFCSMRGSENAGCAEKCKKGVHCRGGPNDLGLATSL